MSEIADEETTEWVFPGTENDRDVQTTATSDFDPNQAKRIKLDEQSVEQNAISEADEPEDFEVVPNQPISTFVGEVIKSYVTYFKNVFVSVTGSSKAILWAAVPAFIYLFNFKKNSADNKLTVTQQTIESGVRDELGKLDYQRELRAMQLEAQKEQEEYDEMMRKKREKSRASLDFMMSQLDDETVSLRRKNMLERREQDMKFEKMRTKQKMENSFKNKFSQLEFELLAAKRRAEEAQRDEQLLELREKHKAKIASMNEEMDEKRTQFLEREVKRKLEMEEEKERSNRRLEEIREEMARKLEEMHRRDAQRRSEMERQLREIHKILQKKVWNEVIENNWTRRLNTLRDSNQDVAAVYRSAKSYSKQGQLSKEHCKSLLAALKSEQLLMEKESLEMRTMYEATGKSFLLEIKKAVELVKTKCDEFSSVLKNGAASIGEVDKCYINLSQASAAIPTLAELKHHYNDNMRSGS